MRSAIALSLLGLVTVTSALAIPADKRGYGGHTWVEPESDTTPDKRGYGGHTWVEPESDTTPDKRGYGGHTWVEPESDASLEKRGYGGHPWAGQPDKRDNIEPVEKRGGGGYGGHGWATPEKREVESQ